MFSGPLIEPWTCTNGSDQPDCSAVPTVRYWYRSSDPTKQPLIGRTVTGPVPPAFQEDDPANPRTAANQVFWEGLVPLVGDTSFVEDAIDAVDGWLAVVEADHRPVPLAQKVIDAREQAGGGDGARVNGSRLELVGFADDRLDFDLMPIEQHVYAGRAFAEVFTPAQQEALREAFPDGGATTAPPGMPMGAAPCRRSPARLAAGAERPRRRDGARSGN